MTRALLFTALLATGFAVTGGCGKDDDHAGNAGGAAGAGGRPEQTGAVCTAPTDCFKNVEAGALKGEPQCLDRVRGGYCTHLCDRTLDHFHGRAVCGARRADSAPPPDESRLIERQVYFDLDEELANSFQMEGHEAAAPPAMP